MRGNAETNKLNLRLRLQLKQQQEGGQEELLAKLGGGSGAGMGEVYLLTQQCGSLQHLHLYTGRRVLGRGSGQGGHSYTFVRLDSRGLPNTKVTVQKILLKGLFHDLHCIVLQQLLMLPS